MRKTNLLLIVATLLTATVARADIGPISIDDFAFGFFPPYRHTAQDLPAGQTIHGFRVVGDWTAAAGDPWSTYVRMYATSPNDGNSAALDFGGEPNSNPYHFQADRYLAFLDGAASAGDWQLSFSSTLPGTTAQMANVEVTLLEAHVASYAGDNATGALWDRPTATFDDISPYGPTKYHVQPFTVGTSGRYDIHSQFSPTDFDGFLLLYAGAFDPANPLAHGLALNDDGRNGQDTADIWQDQTGNALTLTAGETYYLVTTGFDDLDEGTFTNYIGGVGEVTFVPEPLALTILAICALAVLRRPVDIDGRG